MDGTAARAGNSYGVRPGLRREPDGNALRKPKRQRGEMAKLVTAEDPGTAFTRWIRILGRMTIRLVPEYIVLVLVLGAARAWLFPHIGPNIDNSVLWIVGLAIAGTLFVIPTAGEVPIIQAMLSLGMSVGPAGALLMTLPPVSLPSVAMLGRSFPPARTDVRGRRGGRVRDCRGTACGGAGLLTNTGDAAVPDVALKNRRGRFQLALKTASFRKRRLLIAVGTHA